MDRHLRRYFFERQIEDLAGRRIAQRRNQHDIAVVEPLADRLDIDAAHFACPLHVDAVEHADRLRRKEVASDDAYPRARHRRIGDTQRQQGLDSAARVTGAFEHAIERLGVGDAQAAIVATGDVLLLEDGLDLRSRSVHDDQPDAQALQQVEIVDDAEEGVVGDDFSAERDDEGLAAKRVNIGRCGTDPLHECPRRRRMGGRTAGREMGHRCVVARRIGESDRRMVGQWQAGDRL